MTTTIESSPSYSTFRYVARSVSGNRVRGVVEARSPRGARTSLMEQGLQPIRVREKLGLNIQIGAGKVKPTDLMHFSRQLAVFVRAGIPILDAIDGLVAGAENKLLKRTLNDVNDALRSGQMLSEAFAEHPKIFPGYYCGAIQAAERTGNLDSALERLATYLERDIVNRRKLKSAFAYPVIVVILAIVVVIVLTMFVIPRFEGFFAALGADLPLPTRMLIGIMDFFTIWGLPLAAAAILLGLTTSAGSKTTRGRALLDKASLKLPILGNLLNTAIIERFSRALGSMVEAAVPLPEALDIAGEVTNNAVFKARVQQARDRMLGGQGLADPIEQTGLFPVAAVQMIRAGEQTGTLDQQLFTSAEFYGKELDYKLDRYTTLLEPAIIIAVGLGVGFVAIALVSAIYGVIGAVEI